MSFNKLKTETVAPSLPYLPLRARDAWEKYQAIKAELTRVNARVAELEKAKKEQDAILITMFPEGQGARRLPGGKLLVRKLITVEPQVVTPEMVGTTTRKGYSYPEYKEVEL